MNDRFLRALKREPVDCTPVWIMRQAGRYLPEYRAVRRQVPDFMGLCRNPELACEVTMQPLRRFPLDAAILFSDILTIPDAMGLGLHFVEGEGPKFERVVRDAASVDALPVPDVADSLGYVTDAVRWIRRELNGKVPLIGFSGSPWTLATYMIEGGGGHDFVHCKQMLYRTPEILEKLLNKLVLSVTDYLLAQAAAGAQALMIFDSWGGVLAHEKYVHFSLTPMQNIIHNIKKIYPDIPVIMFTKGGGQWLEIQAATGADALGLDWTTNLKTARARVGNQVALQGNLDPQALFGTPQSIEAEVGRILADFGTGSGHVFNLGHGILPSIDPDNVAALVEAVHTQSRVYH